MEGGWERAFFNYGQQTLQTTSSGPSQDKKGSLKTIEEVEVLMEAALQVLTLTRSAINVYHGVKCK